MNRFLSTLIIATVPLAVTAQQVSLQTAKETALQFRLPAGSSQKVQSRDGDADDVTLSYIAQTGNDNDFYVFNYPNDGGFAIISADTRTETPVLAYSDHGSFDADFIPDNAAFVLNLFQRQIDDIRKSNAPETPTVGDPGTPTVIVEPLIKTQWSQGAPYNGMCPIDPVSGERCLTGCNATALAQILNYYRWPANGHGEHHNCKDTLLYVNFDVSTYDWDNTLTQYSSTCPTDKEETISKIMYDCGIAIDTEYMPDGSAAYITMYKKALTTYFDYKPTARYVGLNDLTDVEDPDSAWRDMLRTELDAGRPVGYCGSDSRLMVGHTFICDGYDDAGRFHYNFGWGGYLDGYYLATTVDLRPQDTDCYDNYIGAVIGIEPDRNPGYNDGYMSGYIYNGDIAILDYMVIPYEKPGVLTIPDSITIDGHSWLISVIGPKSFYGHYSITGIRFPSNASQISSYAFYNCPNLKSVEIPANIEYIDYAAFSNCDKLTDVYCYAATPPQIDPSSFPAGVTMHVTAKAAAKYRGNKTWSLFNIVDDLTDNVELPAMTPDKDASQQHYYDIMGRKTDSLRKLRIGRNRKFFFE